MSWWVLFWLALYTQSICYFAFKFGKVWQRYKTETTKDAPP